MLDFINVSETDLYTFIKTINLYSHAVKIAPHR